MIPNLILNKLKQIPSTVSTFIKEATNCKTPDTNSRDRKYHPANIEYHYSYEKKGQHIFLLKGKADISAEEHDQILMKQVIFTIAVYKQKNICNYYDVLVLKTIFHAFLYGHKKGKVASVEIDENTKLKTFHHQICHGYMKSIDFPGIHANLKVVDKFTGKIQRQGIRARIIN